MRISTVCDTNVDIVQLPLNWFLVNARKAAFFRNMYFFLFIINMPAKYNTYRIFPILLHHILVASIHFCLAIRVSPYYFGDFNIWMFSKSASYHTSIIDFRIYCCYATCFHFPWFYPSIHSVNSLHSSLFLAHMHTQRSNRAAKFISSSIESPQNNTCPVRLI